MQGTSGSKPFPPGLARRFEGKVALVTGAGQGIGEAVAFRLSQEGAAVGVLDRNPETAEAVEERIRQIGGRAAALVADVTSAEAVAACVAALKEQFGPVDVLVNNAGFDRAGRIPEA